MSLLTILSETEQLEFDHPPIFSEEARALCFSISDDLESKIGQLRTPTNKVGFLLQYCYFKASKRFFVSNKYRQKDIEYAVKILGISINDVNLSKYIMKIPKDHQKAILGLLGYQSFNEANSLWVKNEIESRIERFTDVKELFFETLTLLHGRCVEIPSYHRLSVLITKYYLEFESKLTAVIKNQLTETQQDLLESLLISGKDQSKVILNNFKFINQSIRPKPIQASLNLFNQISDIFTSLQPIIKILKMTPQTCQYYSTWVKKAKLSQITQFPEPEKKYLHLIAFIQHQYYLRQDAFVDIFIKCVQSAKNIALKKLNNIDKLTRSERRDAVRHVTKSNRNYRSLIDEITEITRSQILVSSEKIRQIDELILSHEKQRNGIKQERIDLFEKSIERMVNDKDYFDILEKSSIKLQRRVSNIVMALVFNINNSKNTLTGSVEYFNRKGGDIDNKAPNDFMSGPEKLVLDNNDKAFRVSLYKILLYIHMADGIKSGDLNLKYSYRYLSIHDYLIDDSTWKKQRKSLLKMAGLSRFDTVDVVLKELKVLLDQKYSIVNQRLLDGLNPYLSVDDEGFSRVTTPALEERETEYIAALLDQNSYVPILRVLSDIDDATVFTNNFKHHSVKNVKRRPDKSMFHAGVIALGCNIGVPKMPQISPGVNENTLLNSVNWYFNRKALNNANQSIVDMIHKLSLSNVFVAEKGVGHSSSDGSKFGVSVESLLASYSFKYFGKDKGISVYTFIDERQALFHSLVMSASEREAAYVIDGLNNNDVTKFDIHSTDTHGYTESIFAATHMLGISFAPRIRKVGKQLIYSFSAKATYEAKGYKVLPSRSINQRIIKEHWDDILRFMVTIKLKKVTASQLFKRLSSYAKSNPLYRAIKEFGRITKSIFILSYYDDVKLRQRIEKQLNRVESSNKFSNAVFYANNSEFSQGSQDEQEIAVACKTLIQNCIILWNYLYLSQLLTNCMDNKEQQEMINLIKEGSVITWRHINLHGEFDFSRHATNESTFNMSRILALKLATAG